MTHNSWRLPLAISALVACSAPDLREASAQPAWHACERDDRPLACRPEHTGDVLTISWRDGQSTRLECETRCEPNGTLLDKEGARWTHELLIQGNSRYTQAHTGSSIFVPLRPLAPALEP